MVDSITIPTLHLANGQAENRGAARAASVSTRPPDQLSLAKRVVFALVPVAMLLFVGEMVVRRTGAALTCPLPEYLSAILWECDPLLHFKMNHSLHVDGQPLNALGTRGPLLDPSARFRIIALGDSVAFGFIYGGPDQDQIFLRQPYPAVLQELVDQRYGPHAVSILNAGVCGYNTYQGIMLLRTRLRRIPTDLLIVQYGWNDLMTTTGAGGEAAFRESSSALVRAGEDLLMRTALYPFGIRLRLELDRYWQERGRRAAGNATPHWDPLEHWVPLEQWTPNIPVIDYEHNLRRIIELARKRGVTVWLTTSPDAFTTREYRDREEAFASTASIQLGMLRLGGIKDYRQFAEIHARYNDAVRRVGAELGVVVVDIEEAFRARSADHLFLDTDAIHPTDLGQAIEAEELYSRLAASGILSPTHTAAEQKRLDAR